MFALQESGMRCTENGLGFSVGLFNAVDFAARCDCRPESDNTAIIGWSDDVELSDINSTVLGGSACCSPFICVYQP